MSSTALEASHGPALNADSPAATTTSVMLASASIADAPANDKARVTTTSTTSPLPLSHGSCQDEGQKLTTTATTASHAKEQGKGEEYLRQCGGAPATSSSGAPPAVEYEKTKGDDAARQLTTTASLQPSPPSSSLAPTQSQPREATSSSADSITEVKALVTNPGATADAVADTTDSMTAPPLASSRAGSRFSMNLASVGLTQANGERAVDMAQDLKKNVVNLWNTWFPTPSATLASMGTDANDLSSSASLERPLSTSPPPRSSTFSGSQTLSHHHMQSPRQPVAERPAKTVRMNSTSVLSSLGSLPSGSNATTPSSSSTASSFTSVTMSTPSPSSAPRSKNTHRRSNSASNRSKSPSLLAGLRPSTPQDGPIDRTSSSSSMDAANAQPPPSSQPRSNSPIYLMGKLYPPSPAQWNNFTNDFTNGLIWCTYRHSYAPIRPSNFTTDVGWGCMLRSGQSLLANALAVQFMGRGWTRPSQADTFWDIYIKVISWFFDDMTSRSPFSVHRIALLGKQLGKNIGEWFGPSTTSQVIKALVDNYPESGLSVYVTTDGVIYKDLVEQTATMKGKSSFGHLLILATIRLGIDKVNPIYHNAIKATFELPQSLGIAGGRPSSSYYFVGYQDNDLFYLDPHHSRCMVEIKDLNQYTEENLATYHCDTIRKIDINSIDPSMLIAFYCKDRSDFDIFCKQVQSMNELLKNDTTAAGQSASEIISVGERAPVYDSGDDMDGQLLTVADEEDDDLELVL